jgi:hypothetical protein
MYKYLITTILIFINPWFCFADDAKLYGSVRVGTFYASEQDNPSTRDKDYTVWELMNNSRFGGVFTNSDIKVGFEFGNGHDGVEIRKLFGIYKIGEGASLLIGKDYTPLNFFPSNQVAPIYENEGDSGLKPYGGIYNGFQTMIQFNTDRLKIALVEPATVDETQLKYGVTGEIERTAPKVELSYHIGSESRYIDAYTGFQTYKIIEDVTSAEYDINSWVIGLNFGYNLGPAYILGNAYSGQNINPYGLWAEGDDSPRIIGGDIYDCTTDGYILVFGSQITENSIAEIGLGYIVHDVSGAVEDDETLSGYINIQHKMNSFFHIVPEIGFVDYMTDNAGNEEGEKYYIGIKWQVDF